MELNIVVDTPANSIHNSLQSMAMSIADSPLFAATQTLFDENDNLVFTDSELAQHKAARDAKQADLLQNQTSAVLNVLDVSDVLDNSEPARKKQKMSIDAVANANALVHMNTTSPEAVQLLPMKTKIKSTETSKQPQPVGFTTFDLINNAHKAEHYKTTGLMTLREHIHNQFLAYNNQVKTAIGERRTAFFYGMRYMKIMNANLGNLITAMDTANTTWRLASDAAQFTKKYISLIHIGLAHCKTLDESTASIVELCKLFTVMPLCMQQVLRDVLELREKISMEATGLIFIGTIVCGKTINYRWGNAAKMIGQSVVVE
jgi:hypothetical protein